MNPFNLTGTEAVAATLIVCVTVACCVGISGLITFEVAKRVCAAVEKVAASIASIWDKP